MLSAFSEATGPPVLREQPLRTLSPDKILYNLVGPHPNPTPFVQTDRAKSVWHREKNSKYLGVSPGFVSHREVGKVIPPGREVELSEIEDWNNE